MVVIALAADAMQGGREKCIKVGMNDYLTKPVDIHALTYAIKKVVLTGSIKQLYLASLL